MNYELSLIKPNYELSLHPRGGRSVLSDCTEWGLGGRGGWGWGWGQQASRSGTQEFCHPAAASGGRGGISKLWAVANYSFPICERPLHRSAPRTVRPHDMCLINTNLQPTTHHLQEPATPRSPRSDTRRPAPPPSPPNI